MYLTYKYKYIHIYVYIYIYTYIYIYIHIYIYIYNIANYIQLVPLVQSFYTGTLNIHWYIAQKLLKLIFSMFVFKINTWFSKAQNSFIQKF